MSTDARIVWCGPVYEATGYADEARGILHALDGIGLPVTLRPVVERQIPGFRNQLAPALAQALQTQEMRAAAPPFVLVEHAPADGFVPAPMAAAVVGRTMFEADAIPPSWVWRCNELDAVWVPSTFNVDTFRRSGVRVPIAVVPGGVDSAKFTPDGPAFPLPDVRGTVFLSVFEWRMRKGWDVLLRAWSSAFHRDDDVTLVIRSHLPSNTRQRAQGFSVDECINDFLRTECGTSRESVAPIVVLSGLLAEHEMPMLYRSANAFVCPTRGEGWGRPFMEAMATALPVLATRWSAHLDYMNDRNSLLIDIEGLVPANEDSLDVYQGLSWAQPRVTHLVELLRFVHLQPDAARAVGAQARVDMQTHWHWRRAAEAVQREADALSKRATPSSRMVENAGPSPNARAATDTVTCLVTLRSSLFHPRESPLALESLAPDLASALGVRGAALRVDHRDGDTRPALSSVMQPLWQSRDDPLPKGAGQCGLYWYSAADDASRVVPQDQHVVICTGDAVQESVPEWMVGELLDRADDIWVPHATARAAVLAAGVPALRIWQIPDTPLLDSGYVEALATVVGIPMEPVTKLLLPVMSVDDIAVAEQIVRLWPRVGSRSTTLAIRVAANAAPAVNDWMFGLMPRTETVRGLERVSVRVEECAQTAIPALLRDVDVLISPVIRQHTVTWWRVARDLGVALMAIDDSLLDGFPDEAVWRIARSATGTLSGAALMDAIRSACDAPSMMQRRNAMRAAAASLPSHASIGEQMAARLASIALGPTANSSGTAS